MLTTMLPEASGVTKTPELMSFLSTHTIKDVTRSARPAPNRRCLRPPSA